MHCSGEMGARPRVDCQSPSTTWRSDCVSIGQGPDWKFPAVFIHTMQIRTLHCLDVSLYSSGTNSLPRDVTCVIKRVHLHQTRERFLEHDIMSSDDETPVKSRRPRYARDPAESRRSPKTAHAKGKEDVSSFTRARGAQCDDTAV